MRTLGGVREQVTRYSADSASDQDLLKLIGIKAESVESALVENKGTVRNITALSALREIIRRSTRTKERSRITSPRQAGEYLLPKVVGLTEEVFAVVALDARGGVVGEAIVSKGTCTATLISPREVYRTALAMGATSALVWHNHPSGDPSPSREDVALTARLRASGESLGVPLADHLILGKDRYHSFRAAEGWDR